MIIQGGDAMLFTFLGQPFSHPKGGRQRALVQAGSAQIYPDEAGFAPNSASWGRQRALVQAGSAQIYPD